MVRRGGIDDPRRLRWPPSGTADPLTARSCPDLVVTILFPDLDSTGRARILGPICLFFALGFRASLKASPRRPGLSSGRPLGAPHWCLPLMGSIRFQRDGSGTTGALPRLRQSRYVPLPAGCLTLINDHRLFILRPRCFTSPPGPAPTGRHA